MSSIATLESVLLEYCAALKRSLRYGGEPEQLSHTLFTLLMQSDQVPQLLDDLSATPTESELSALHDAVVLAVGSYFRYLEQKGSCEDADGITQELATVLSVVKRSRGISMG